MSQFQSKYSFELWSPTGSLLADLSGRALQRKVEISRNEPEDIEWALNLDDWEKYCRSINVDPRNILIPGQTEVRVKRLGTYLCGGKVVYSYPFVSAKEQSLTIMATGFLDLFGSRYTGTTNAGTVQESWDTIDGSAIAWGLINQSQSKTNGDFGVTLGSLATTGVHTRNYQSTNLRDAIQDFGKVQSNPFDHKFTYDKKFYTYASIGNNRPDVIFEFPKNIIEVGVPNNATGIANAILAKGQGAGTAGSVVESDDTASQLSYALREKIITSNATDDSDNGLTDAANAERAAWAFPFEIPEITVNGNIAPFITDYGIGDRVKIRLKNYKTFAHIDGLFRIEMITLRIDEDDNETIKLKVSI